MLSLALMSLAAVGTAQASALLDPQNRLHVGVSVVDAPSPVGIGVGFDSRLTRIVSMDIGGFVSPVPILPGVAADVASGDGYPGYFELRHGLYITPGFRIPHAQPRTWAFDFLVRAGGGAVWIANTDPARTGFKTTNYIVSATPAAIAGGEALVRFGSVGVRVTGKAVGFSASVDTPPEGWFLVRSQWGVEGFYQW